MVSDPWGSLPSRPHTQEKNPDLEFEDNFHIGLTKPAENKYVALDDSSSYLERLQKKLDRVQGNAGAPSSQSLLAGLKSARQCHHHHFLSAKNTQNSVPSHNDEPTTDDLQSSTADLPHARGLILSERQRHVDNLLLKFAPDRIALSPDELVYLLSADLLDSLQVTGETADNSETEGSSETGSCHSCERTNGNISSQAYTSQPNILNSSESSVNTNDTKDVESSEEAIFVANFEAVNFEDEKP